MRALIVLVAASAVLFSGCDSDSTPTAPPAALADVAGLPVGLGCGEASAYLERENLVLPQDYASVRQMPTEFIQVLMGELSQAEHLQLWKRHVIATSTSMDLGPDGREFVTRFLRRTDGFAPESEEVDLFAQQAVTVLGRDRTYELFVEINPDVRSAASPERLDAEGQVSSSGGLTCECNLSWFGDFCDRLVGPARECTELPRDERWLCGILFAQKCNGLCQDVDDGSGGAEPVDPIATGG